MRARNLTHAPGTVPPLPVVTTAPSTSTITPAEAKASLLPISPRPHVVVDPDDLFAKTSRPSFLDDDTPSSPTKTILPLPSHDPLLGDSASTTSSTLAVPAASTPSATLSPSPPPPDPNAPRETRDAYLVVTVADRIFRSPAASTRLEWNESISWTFQHLPPKVCCGMAPSITLLLPLLV
jgi:hypothetical protein